MKKVVAVPIQALTVREMLFDAQGKLVHEELDRRGRRIEPTVSASNEPPPGHTRKETEGVFVLREGKAVFTPVKIGVAGEKYFEVLSGLKAGDQVITGPFASVRELADGQNVKLQAEKRKTGTAASAQ
jgi:HlyD family secretion protein